MAKFKDLCKVIVKSNSKENLGTKNIFIENICKKKKYVDKKDDTICILNGQRMYQRDIDDYRRKQYRRD